MLGWASNHIFSQSVSFLQLQVCDIFVCSTTRNAPYVEKNLVKGRRL